MIEFILNNWIALLIILLVIIFQVFIVRDAKRLRDKIEDKDNFNEPLP
jgi:hypothetical protein